MIPLHCFNRQFKYLTSELAMERYRTHTVNELVQKPNLFLDPSKIHVVIRCDVDSDPDMCLLLSEEFADKKLKASFYFLTNPERHYDIWKSQVLAKIAQKGFEIGLHSDHLYEEIMGQGPSLERIKKDINKLKEISGTEIYGITAHGHPDIDSTDRRNWDVYNCLLPEEIGLNYHDGLLDDIIKERSIAIVRDHLRVANGWRYWPKYPQVVLRRLQPGSIVMFIVHPDSFFERITSAPKTRVKDIYGYICHFVRIRLRHQIVGAFITPGRSPASCRI